MSNTSDIRNGLCIKHNHDIYKIIEFLHVKPGKGPAIVRTKLKSLTSGKVVDNTFSAGHKIDVVRVETNKFTIGRIRWRSINRNMICNFFYNPSF